MPIRLLHVARDISLFLSASGPDEARAVVERRAGAAYEPRLARLALGSFDELLADLDETRMWEQALESEPFPKVWIAGERVDAAFMAIAALTGLKSPWLREHSTGVADLAETLGISPKTVGHHVQHVYQKAGVNSRAAATLWAFQHDLVHTG